MQTDILMFFQNNASPLLDKIAESITMLGEENFYIAIIAFVFWNVSKKAGFTLAICHLFSALFNAAVKLIVRAPRPFEALEFIEARRLHTATGYSFPSGHTQGAAGFFTASSLLVRRRWFTVIAAVLIFLVGITRLYLRVHWPLDVLFGWIFGIFAAWGAYVLVTKTLENKKLFNRVFISIGSVLLAVMAVLLILDGTGALGEIKIADFFKLTGTTIGALVGFFIEEKKVRFNAGGKIWIRGLRYVLGIGTTFALLMGLKALFPYTNPFHCLRYALVGLWLTLLFPWIGQKIKLFVVEENK